MARLHPPSEIKPDITILGAEEYEPDDAQDQNRKAGRDRQQRQYGGSGFGLPRLGRGFDDLAVSLRCHGDLFS